LRTRHFREFPELFRDHNPNEDVVHVPITKLREVVNVNRQVNTLIQGNDYSTKTKFLRACKLLNHIRFRQPNQKFQIEKFFADNLVNEDEVDEMLVCSNVKCGDAWIDEVCPDCGQCFDCCEIPQECGGTGKMSEQQLKDHARESHAESLIDERRDGER